MIIKENITVYKCEFCNKKLYKKHAMIKHEDLCLRNPKNNKACYDCAFLDKININVYWSTGNSDYIQDSKNVQVFECKKLDKLMFPFSIERKNLHKKYETYSEQEPMPKDCIEFKEREDYLY